MNITSIQAQVRRSGRYSVFIDGAYSFSLSDTALLEAKLVPGQELSAERVAQLRQLAIDDALHGQALRYALLRPRSAWEIEQYLLRKHASPRQQQRICAQLRTLGIIEDTQFARLWVENRRLLKHVSRRRLEQELRQKRIDDAIIRAVLADDAHDDRAALNALIMRKRKQATYQDDKKLLLYLVRQGFSYDDIKQALHADDIKQVLRTLDDEAGGGAYVE